MLIYVKYISERDSKSSTDIIALLSICCISLWIAAVAVQYVLNYFTKWNGFTKSQRLTLFINLVHPHHPKPEA